jgi:hypothetical protein
MTHDQAMSEIEKAGRAYGDAVAPLIDRLRAGAMTGDEYTAQVTALGDSLKTTISRLAREAGDLDLMLRASWYMPKTDVEN